MGVELARFDRPANLPRKGGAVIAAAAPAASRQPSVEAEDVAFRDTWFPELKAAGRYAIPGGILGDPTPLSSTPSSTPATRPPTGQVRRPPQGPNSAPPPAYVGPAVAPATPSTTVTPLTAPPPAQTAAEAHARRVGGAIKPDRPPVDITKRQPAGSRYFTR